VAGWAALRAAGRGTRARCSGTPVAKSRLGRLIKPINGQDTAVRRGRIAGEALYLCRVAGLATPVARLIGPAIAVLTVLETWTTTDEHC